MRTRSGSRTIHDRRDLGSWPRSNSSRAPNSALVGGVLAFGWSAQREIVEIDWLLAGGAAAGPALPDGLQQQHRLRECQSGRWRFGSARSSVRKPWAAVTSVQWW